MSVTLFKECDADALGERLARGELFWLDLHGPTTQDYELLRDVFAFHPLAIEDSINFGQRPKLEDYDDFVFLVLYGASTDEDRLVEVHCFYSDRFLVTVRRDEAPALEELERRLSVQTAGGLLHRIVDALVDSFFPVLAEVDERLDEIQESMLRSAQQAHLNELFELRRRLFGFRRVIAPQRDLVGRIVSGTAPLPALTEEAERYFRDVYDHLIRLADAVDAHRDLIAGSMDLYLSTASNRLNSVMKQLAVIATFFLPLTFITGFFGQNFDWLVAHVGGVAEFVALGVGLELAVAIALYAYFKRQDWF